jgi:hypothetical protein
MWDILKKHFKITNDPDGSLVFESNEMGIRIPNTKRKTHTPAERAKLILDLCAFELKDMPVWAQMNIEVAIKSQIEVAIEDALACATQKNNLRGGDVWDRQLSFKRDQPKRKKRS